MTDAHAAVAAAAAKRGDPIGYFIYRQGHAIPFSGGLAVFFLFWNPHSTTAVGGALWVFIPMLVIFGWYLCITQVLPVVSAPIFESHLAAYKDLLGVSLWPILVTGVMMILSWTLGEVEVFGIQLNIDMTLHEYAIAAMVGVAFIIDAMGSIFTLIKNRLASEEGMGRMPS